MLISGNSGKHCIDCHNKNVARRKDIKLLRENHLINRIIENECCCEKCKRIYLEPAEGTEYAVEIETYDFEGSRMIDFDKEKHFALDFIHENIDRLELAVLDQDHLTETEQRERGLLTQDDPFVGKRALVSGLVSRDAIELESLKTQLLCCRCHAEETIRRRKGCIEKARQKKAYVDDCKKKAECSLCSYKNPLLLPFFDYDHIDIYSKIANISAMVQSSQYTLNDIAIEMKKCRLLCRHCHRIHTRKQHEQGLISAKKFK